MNFQFQRAGKNFKTCRVCGHPLPERLAACDNRRGGVRCNNTDLAGPHKRYRTDQDNNLVCIDEN